MTQREYIMAFRKTKRVELSPKLKLGVGRSYSSGSLLKVTGTVFLLLALALTIQTLFRIGKYKNEAASTASQPLPQVLGESDNANNAADNHFIIHTVKQGETLFSIAQIYGNASWSTIATLNNISPPFNLKIGQQLKVPKP